MKTFFTLITALVVAGAVCAADAKRPNIVLIFIDDLGWKDVDYQGADYYETPNIDRLSKQGMVFTAGYAPAGNCQGSRASLMSGQYTPRHMLFANGSSHRGVEQEMRLVPIPTMSGLASESVTVAEALKAAGYATGIFGKWHLDNKKPGVPPGQQGFDTVFESYGGWKQSQTVNPKGIYSLTKAAGEFMKKNKEQEKPFFVYLAHYAIHVGHQTLPATLAKLKAKARGKEHNDPSYAACLYDLDDGVGILMQTITDLGLADNTLVIFTSDNGGSQSSQEPLRGNKGSHYEGGIREPFFAIWPGKIKPGTTCDVPVISQDLYPTFLAAAGAAVPKGKVLDGENLLPLLAGKNSLQRQAIFWHFPGYLDNPTTRGRPIDVKAGFRSRPVSVIHKGDWKLHLFYEEWVLDGCHEKLPTNHAVELYNLKDDIGECHDLALLNPTKRDELLAALLAWQTSINAPIPSKPNPAYAPGTAPKGKRRAKSADEESD